MSSSLGVATLSALQRLQSTAVPTVDAIAQPSYDSTLALRQPATSESLVDSGLRTGRVAVPRYPAPGTPILPAQQAAAERHVTERVRRAGWPDAAIPAVAEYAVRHGGSIPDLSRVDASTLPQGLSADILGGGGIPLWMLVAIGGVVLLVVMSQSQGRRRG